ncbi:MAG: beta-N-acetylglucosaminidase domain-containing protein [Bacteroidaceae bacterium]|nr:beta-N-acetylglucosaminidase domain-containing protein [Bacteroidaceae bacterium]
MKRLLLSVSVLLMTMSLSAQQPSVSPIPQTYTYGDKAFNNNVSFSVIGGDKADADAMAVLKASGLTFSGDGEVCLRIGERNDKSVRKYRKNIPSKSEGYYLRISNDEVVIAGNDESGTFYGVQTFLQLMSSPEVSGCEISDWPSVDCRGVIEGFYGNPWSHKDRLRQFDFYGKNKMNTYVYGPKDDPYHRAHWREPYPENEAAKIRELVDAAHRNKVQFVWAVHPGGDIKWNKTDSVAVVNKLKSMYELGVRTFAVFFDDISGEGTKAEKQAGLMNYITDNFVHEYPGVMPLVICPTQYNKLWAGGDYLKTLGTQMYKEVRIMWTGNSVVDMIDKSDMEWINSQIGRKAFIWLNYPVNDYCQSRLLMGKTYGNGLDIADMLSGFCSNPMEYSEASKVSLYSIADYTWNMPRYDSVASWERSLSFLMPTSSEEFRFFCENNIDLGRTGHGLRREGDTPLFDKAHPWNYSKMLIENADRLLADSVNNPEMIGQIRPWVESMRLLGQSGEQLASMNKALLAADTVAFIGHYKAFEKVEEARKAIISRNYKGSIVKASPVVSGEVYTPWVKETVAALLKQYKSRFTYRLDVFPQAVIADGSYFIKVNGKYLTDAQASSVRVGDWPVLVAERDSVKPLRQEWTLELRPATGRYKVTNVQDGRYVNEVGAFWKDKQNNPYDDEWHSFIIEKKPNGRFTFQCAGSAGNGYWNTDGNRIVNRREAVEFELIPTN